MKRPSFQFYPGDWLRDTSLRSCSLAARGAWMDMLCLMHEGYPYGHLKVGNKVILPDNLARMIGATLPETEGYLRELEDAGVFSRDGSGCIYSRRMVKDEELRCKRADGGHLGGNPNLLKGDKTDHKDNPKVGWKVNLKVGNEDNQIPTPSSSSSSSPAKDTASPSAPLALEAEAPKTPRPKKPAAPLGQWDVINGVELPESLRSENCLTAVREFVEYRRRKRKPLIEMSLSRKLAFFSKNFTAATLPAAIERTIEKGWEDVYPATSDSKPQGAPSTAQIQAVPITDPTDFRFIHNLPNHCPFVWQHWLGQDPECNLVREHDKETTPPERKKEIMDQAIWCWKRNGDKIRNYWSQYTL